MDSILGMWMRLYLAFRPALILQGISAAIASLFLIGLARRAREHFRTRRFDALSFKMHGQWRGDRTRGNRRGNMAKRFT